MKSIELNARSCLITNAKAGDIFLLTVDMLLLLDADAMVKHGELNPPTTPNSRTGHLPPCHPSRDFGFSFYVGFSNHFGGENPRPPNSAKLSQTAACCPCLSIDTKSVTAVHQQLQSSMQKELKHCSSV
eukprot:scaffold1099_cov143-Skeletonema_dohrnii-CCMP3373.AAC.4